MFEEKQVSRQVEAIQRDESPFGPTHTVMHSPASHQHMIFVLHPPPLLSLSLLDLQTYFFWCAICANRCYRLGPEEEDRRPVFTTEAEKLCFFSFLSVGAAFTFAFCTTLLTPAVCTITIAYSASLSGSLFLGRGKETFQVFCGKPTVSWRSLLKGDAFISEVEPKHRTLFTQTWLQAAMTELFLRIKLSTNIRKHSSESPQSSINMTQSPSILSGHYANIAIKPQLDLFTRPSRLINVPTIQQPEHPSRKEVPLCLITAEMKF